MNDDQSEETLDLQRFTDESPNPAGDADLSVLCDALQEHDIRSVVVRYQGSGDEGSIDEVEFEPADTHLPEWIINTLEDVAERYCPDGYENNEGGYGSLTVYPLEGLAKLEHSDCYEDSEAIDTPTATLSRGLRKRLAKLGVQRVTARFDGYGDSGQIESVEVEPETVSLAKDLQDELEDFLIERLPGGWEINAGSWGEFTVNVPAGHVEVAAYWRVEADTEPQVTRWKWRQ
jgi:hypothetical protein